MSALFRSFQKSNSSYKRERAVREALVNTLEENSREVEFEVRQTGVERIEHCEPTSSLCTTLEAVFLHGLKESFFWQTINLFASDVDRRPEPSFWSPLMVFMHKEAIQQMQSLSQVTTEIGLCRAWIRQTLNDDRFSTYLINIRKNPSALRPYYKKCALLNDGECLDNAIKIVGGLETQVHFNLPVNTSLYNNWPDRSLQLSGLWSPAIKSCPVSCGVDIASSIGEDSTAIPMPRPIQTDELFSESISSSPFKAPRFDGAAFKSLDKFDLLLQKSADMAAIDEEQLSDDANELDERTLHDALTDEAHVPKSCTNNTLELDFDAVNNDNLSHPPSERSLSVASATSSMLSPQTDRCSYNALLRKHERRCEPDWTEVWEKFLMENNADTVANTSADMPAETEQGAVSATKEGLSNSGFEMLSSLTERFSIAELQNMVEQLCRLPREPGLDAQGFLCNSCQHPLGIGYKNIQVCAFSGNYYCEGCMDPKPLLIPARVIYNWDLRKHLVSKRAAAFLSEFRSQPFIDLKLLNPTIYQACETMAELQSIRICLNFIRAYLCTCSNSNAEEFRKQLFGKEYLFEHIHQYSIEDLTLIQRGTLQQQLQKAYKIGEAHILKCNLCSFKGFICEICQGSRVLYPFHIETTFRCELCGSVFHADCLNACQPCPKCERLRKREVQPLLEAVQNLKLKSELAQNSTE